MDNETPWILTIKTDQLFWVPSNTYEMYPVLVYFGGFSLLAMYGDGDPDITAPGEAKVYCEVTKIVADAIKADSHCYHVYADHAVEE